MELSEARNLSLELAPPMGVESIRIEDAPGRVLAYDLKADCDLPRASRSRLDGFALRSSDSSTAKPGAPVYLRLQPDLLAAGHTTERAIGEGDCIKILTGAIIPRNADAVVPFEDVSVEGDLLVLIRPLGRWSGVSVPGEEVKRGEVILFAGTILTPTRLALVAAFGHAEVSVYRRPRVALLSTGSEVIELGEVPGDQHSFCNNRHLLAWAVRTQGGEPIHLGVVRDDPLETAKRLREIDSDFVITTGGMGAGERDFVLKAWKELGMEIHFQQINMAPGRNSALGKVGNQVFWGLPGRPWAAQAVFEELIAPSIRRAQGLGDMFSPRITAKLGATLKKKKGFYKVVRGVLNMQMQIPSFTPSDKRNESRFAAIKDSFAYIILESHMVEVSAGSEVQVRLHDLPLSAFPCLGQA
jgi:molybdopterin molybdotransferase